MTKHHFIAIAAVLAGDYAVANDAGKVIVRNITFSLADVFDRENPRFNRPVFYQAVFGDSGPIA